MEFLTVPPMALVKERVEMKELKTMRLMDLRWGSLKQGQSVWSTEIQMDHGIVMVDEKGCKMEEWMGLERGQTKDHLMDL